PPAPVVVEELNIVEDDVEVEQLEILSSEDDQSSGQVETYVPPAVVEEEEESSTHIFTVVEEMPEFPGGDSEMLKFISRSIKYPVIAQENGIQGRVVCTFTVNQDGSVVDAEVVRGFDPSLDKEALRVIGTMPKWKPGKQRGKAVRVRYTLPIVFRLQ
ncbi:MAG: energy transducer TonB, partial [Tannerellaceae bacterium]|nr:energy transducer TonB [Tannerellaceae bacterium]